MLKPPPKGCFTGKWPPITNIYPYSRRTVEGERRKVKANTNIESDQWLNIPSGEISVSSDSQNIIGATESSVKTSLARRDTQTDMMLSYDNTAMITVPMMIKTKKIRD